MNGRILTIIDTRSHLTEVSLNDYGKETLQIGRNREQNEIVIPDGIISKIHGSIRQQGERIYYKDLDSRNGTFVGCGGQKRLLSGKDGYVEIFDKSVLRIGNIHAPDRNVLLLFSTRPEGEGWIRRSLDSEEISIGRSEENQIVLKHPGVSKIHCRIQKKNEKCVLLDNRSANGTMVNGENLSGPRVLKDKDVIQILDFQLFFSDECVYYQAMSKGISLRVCDLNKSVGLGKKKKQILKNINCEIQANEFVAIIGGSGAGKTTFMNAISGFEQEFEGKIYCNGIDLVEQFQNLKNIIGFVPQQDIIYENLTLRRMLYYTAKMKMPEDTGKEEISQRIEEVLGMVDLKEHQETYIRKLSGGQKKRASIAVELLADPKLFYLDEPTSGLDPGTEKNLMQTLCSLARKQNKTIIMVTHTTQNLHLCDKVIFMGPGGRLCFCGNVNAAKAFYQTEDLVDIYNRIAEAPWLWEKRFSKQSRMHEDVFRNTGKTEVSREKKSPGFRQFLILSRRYAELLWNDRQRLSVLLLQPLLIALLLNVVADQNIFKIYESTKSMLFALSCSGIWIGLFNSIQEICKERAILKREYMANLKLTGYILSKFVLQSVLGFVQAAILTLVFMGLVGKDQKGLFVQHFSAEIVFTVWLTVMASVAMGFVISSMVRSGDKAMAAAPFVLIVQLLFSGILFSLKGAGKWISYCTVSRWSVEALGSIAKLNRLELKLQKDFPMLEHKAESFFKASRPHVLQAWMILTGMILLFIVISIISLRNVSKDRR